MYSFTYILLGLNKSMLPNIKKIIIVSTITLINSICYSSEWGSKEETNEKLFSVEVIDSSAQTIKDSIVFSSTTEAFRRIEVKSEVMTTIEKVLVKAGSKVRCIVTKKTKDKPRSFFDNIDKWAKEQGASGLAYFTIEKDKKIIGKGPVGKFFSEDSLKEIMKIKQLKKNKLKTNINKNFKKISLFELQNSPKFLNFRVRA